MGNRLDAAPGEVQIRDLARAQDAERIHPLRGAIDQAIAGERRRRHEEHVLPLDPLGEFGCDAVVGLAHTFSIVLRALQENRLAPSHAGVRVATPETEAAPPASRRPARMDRSRTWRPPTAAGSSWR